jgi:hypothetical protein
MKYELYTDVSGKGDGDLIGTFETLDEATTEGDKQWTPEVGYAIHRDGCGPPVVMRPPTHPDPDPGEHDGWIDMFERGYF